ncbi:MAG: monovalent cation/H+ antiporter complex subunit F [Candidatus Bipolaricaulia bacterium]
MIATPITFFAVAGALMLFAAFAMVRLALGPTAADRAVGLDTVNTLVVALMIVLGAAYDQAVLIDVAIVYALLSFIGTLYIARYLEGGLE